ncbi:MAG TPA: alpha-1,2-fucosyltransferase [Chitinophagaceae bacterium]|nr:alpha-1,2-fucosyltransferase [Chitinophagaceae bacterium]
MIIVNIYGGLGNQLFQYAAGRQLAEKHRATLKLDIRTFKSDRRREYSLHHFNIKEVFYTAFDKIIIRGKERIGKVLNGIGIAAGRAIYVEQDLHFDKKIPELGNNIYLDGYWGNERYFKAIENIIRNEFTVKNIPDGMNEMYLKKIRATNSIAIHVRRGDYVSNKETNAVHGVCSIPYYREAIAQICSKLNNPFFFIFSDDILWVKENLVINEFPVDYIKHNYNLPQEDLRLMYSCRHNIIANSSFSWWGAWLNNNPGKIVIAPEKWSNIPGNKTVLPEHWIKLHDPLTV